MGLPFMPLYVADYLGDTMHLSLEQHGAYLRLLMCLWRAGGKLPNDRLKIARMVGVSGAKWDKISPEVMAFFGTDGTDFWSERLNRELLKNIKSFGVSVASADSAERTKVRKRLRSDSHISESQPEPEPDLFGESQTRVTGASFREAVDRIWSDAPLASRKRSSKGAVETALRAAIGRRKNVAVIVQALANYFADPDKAKEDHRYAKGVHRVIQDDYWETWAAAEGVHHLEPSGRPEWNQRMILEGWVASGCQPSTGWHRDFGPTPDEPGCAVTPAIMAEYGYVPGQKPSQETRLAVRAAMQRRGAAG